MNYKNIKNTLDDAWTEYKPKVILIAVLIVIFISGYGAGRGERNGTKPVRRQLNYTTNTTARPSPSPTKITKNVSPKISNTNRQSTAECHIKGNVGSGKKTYHIPGGAFYNRTNAELCFNTEEEAQAAGFTKSSR